MSASWQQQVRVTLAEPAARRLRDGSDDPSLAPLRAVLRRHEATAVSQLDAFEAFLADPRQADTPLGRWTRATLADEEKRAKHGRAFAVRVRGAEVYPGPVADALQADLDPLVGPAGGGVIERLSRHDTNPASNLPIPPEYRA